MALRAQLITAFYKRRRESDFWLHVLFFGFLALSFWPVTVWMFQTTYDQSRLVHALMVLVLATVALIKFGRIEIVSPLRLGPSARRALIISYGLLITQFIAQKISPEEWVGTLSLLAIPAYCYALAGLVRFVFGEGTRRITRTTASTLCVFILLSLFMQPLDWPLRGLAGKWSATALEFIGKQVELGLVGLESGPPKLIMLVNEHPFHVASECNGFGVILTSLLIAFLLVLYRKLHLLDAVTHLMAGLFLGFAFNILRIVLIVLLAPSLMEHYMLMHEIVGGITYWGCLLCVWALLKGPTGPEAIQDQSQSEST